MEIKNKGIELEVYEPDGTTRLGDLVITKTDLIWCTGKTRRENGIKMKWAAFVEVIQKQGKAPKKTVAKKTAAKKSVFPAK
ncbi:MAG: hypothetical protein ACRYFU_12790 [Janthinobacterium lividum]